VLQTRLVEILPFSLPRLARELFPRAAWMQAESTGSLVVAALLGLNGQPELAGASSANASDSR